MLLYCDAYAPPNCAKTIFHFDVQLIVCISRFAASSAWGIQCAPDNLHLHPQIASGRPGHVALTLSNFRPDVVARPPWDLLVTPGGVQTGSGESGRLDPMNEDLGK